MDRHLYIVSLRYIHSTVYRLHRRAPVLVYLQSAHTRLNLFFNRLRTRAVSLTQQRNIHGHRLYRLEHHLYAPYARGDGCAVGAVRGSYAAANECGYTIAQRCLRLLWRDEVNVTVNACCSKYQMFTRDGIRRRSRNEVGIDTIHRVGVARATYARNQAILDAHIRLYNAQQRVYNRHIGDDQIQRTRLRGHRICKPHTVAQRLAAAIYHLVAIAA